MISKHRFGMDGERYQKSQVPKSMFAASNQWHAKRTAEPETNATPENATSRCIISNRKPPRLRSRFRFRVSPAHHYIREDMMEFCAYAWLCQYGVQVWESGMGLFTIGLMFGWGTASNLVNLSL